MGEVQQERSGDAARAHLGVWDAVSLIVGIVVGTAIFKSPPLVFSSVETAAGGMILWAVGGVLAWLGALCYAELSSTYPQFGAEYIFLNRAYGSLVGFLFAWMQLLAILTGSMGAMAFVFADYSAEIFPEASGATATIAAGSVTVLLAFQLTGVAVGRRLQNLLSAAKVIGLLAVLGAGFVAVAPAPPSPVAGVAPYQTNIGLALVFVLYAYGGWNDAAAVAAEVRDVRQNLPRALIFGVGGILVLYLAINLAYLWGLGLNGLRLSAAPAASLVRNAWGSEAGQFVSLLVMISALGAINGMMFAGSRLLAAVGSDYPTLAWLKIWTARGVPMWSFMLIASISVSQILILGTELGRDAIDDVFAACFLPLPDWQTYGGGFDTLVAATAPLFWVFFLLSAASLLVLRKIDPDRPRPYRVPGYPITPILFCSVCAYMLRSSLLYAGSLAYVALLPLAIGGVLYAGDWCVRTPSNEAGPSGPEAE